MMINHINDYTVLNNGVKMPWLGLGVNNMKGNSVVKAINYALGAGYRSIDAATLYGNEAGVGKAIKESNVPREEIFITTKLWTSTNNEAATLKAFDKSRKNLNTDYIDLYLINSPIHNYAEAWNTMTSLYEKGLIKAIGVSNFNIQHLENLKSLSSIIPAVNQVEYHPWLTQEKLLEYCKNEGIQIEAWSPLCRGEIIDDKTIISLSSKYGKTPAQIVLRWDLDNGVVTIPKSVKEKRIIENADIFDFTLSEEDIQMINQLNKNRRWMWSYGL